MPWKCRKNHLYFYRSKREGRRVVTEYLGRGVLAALASEAAELEAQDRQQRTLIARAEREARARRERDLGTWYRGVDTLVGEFLRALGYHKHKGTWRRKRMSKDELTLVDRSRVAELAKKAKEGSAQAAGQLAELLAGDPERLIRLGVGDVAEIAENQVVCEMSRRSGGVFDELFSEAIRARLAKMRGELAGPDPSPIETLLADRIAICWLRVQMAEIQVSGLALQERGYTAAAMEYRTWLLGRAQKRYLSALKALAQVRRLGLPRIQLNIGEKQVNVVN